MKKIGILIAIVTSCFGVYAQSDYYWYKGQKVFLEIQPTKKYILFESVETDASMKQKLSTFASVIKSIGKTGLSRNVKLKSLSALKERSWAIVENKQAGMASIANSPNVLYEGNFYKATGKDEAGISHLFYVKLRNVNDLPSLEKLASVNNVEILGNNKFMPLWYTLSCNKLSKGNSLKMSNSFYESNLFEAAEPDFMVNYVKHCVDDSYFANQWGLKNTGQNGGKSDIDIRFCQANEITKGSSDVVIAINDEGIESNHPDIANTFSQSYDTETGSYPSVIRGNHGTACAGIVGANSNNKLGVSGIASDCPLMSISNFFKTEVDAAQKLADGINYAWENGASVISNSWGCGSNYSSIIEEAIQNALSNGRDGLGCVVVFSTGNDNGSVAFPANSIPDILAVGAISPCGERKSLQSCDKENWGSNYGSELDIMAPGVLVPTTDLTGTAGYNTADGASGNYYQKFNGTSAATPHVVAVAGLILSINPDLTQKEVVDIIEKTAQKVGSYSYTTKTDRNNGTWNNEVGYGLLDAYAAVLAAKKTLCYENLNITEAIRYDTKNYVASISITANNIITDGANVHYGALKSIKLTKGFHAYKVDKFVADLHGCVPTKSGRIQNFESNEEFNLNYDISNKLPNINLGRESISVFPNPSSGRFNVVVNDIKGVGYIRIFNFSGKQILYSNINGSKQVDLSTYGKGIYILKIELCSNTFVEKIIVQ